MELSVNVTSCPTHAVTELIVKFGTGLAYTFIVIVRVLLDPELDAVNLTVYVPGVVYTALTVVLKDVELFPLLKSHNKEVKPVDKLVKVTLKGAQPEAVFTEKLATT